MLSHGKSINLRNPMVRLISVCFFAVMLIVLNQGIDARPMAKPWGEFVDIRYRAFVTEFVRAYTKAGFRLKHKKSLEKMSTILEFDYLPPGHLSDKKGGASFRIYSSNGANNDCSPCSVYNITWGPYQQDDGSNEFTILWQEIKLQVDKANALLIEKLRKHYRKLEFPVERCIGTDCPQI